jgi:hypothetical protein
LNTELYTHINIKLPALLLPVGLFCLNTMQLLIPNECHYCGLVDEAKFVYAGPHVKQICNGCGKYIKFFDKAKIPDSKETKLAIWAITTDIDSINESKNQIGFVDGLKGLDLKMIYWRLYLEVRRKALISQ